MKTKLLTLILICAPFGVFAQPMDSTFFYLNGVPEYYCQQPDVCSFRLQDKSEYSGTFDPLIVMKVDYMGPEDGIHYVHFTATASTLQKLQVANQIENSTGFEKFFMVATKSDRLNESCNSRYWRGTDMQISIIFKDPEITATTVQNFAASYEMDVIFSPSPNIPNGVYVLEVSKGHKLHPYDSPTLAIDIAREMWENDNTIIDKVTPSFRMFWPDDPNDPLYTDMWWAEDDVLTPTCNGTTGDINAEIGLDCAWNLNNEFGTGASYTGAGVNVAVIDFDGYQYSHPDCSGMFAPTGYVCPSLSNPFVNTFNSDFYFPLWFDFRAHGQNVSGIIGARMDNGEGAAGIAPGCTITPCVFKGTEAQFNAMLMKLLELDGPDEIDIINMSFEIGNHMTPQEATGYPFYSALVQCHFLGRSELLGNPLGMLLFASTGNDNGEYVQIPAALPFVFSVGATNPNDQRKSAGDGFDPTSINWGGTYFEYMDVSAPGICIVSTDFVDGTFGVYGADGYEVGDYNQFSGTSAATPIVSGIAALILEKEPTLNNNLAYNAIRYSCDKVGGYTYSNPNADGRTLELGYGRVNACKALQAVDQLTMNENESIQVVYNNPVSDFLNVTFEDQQERDISIYSVTGQIIYQQKVSGSFVQIDMSNFADGVYYLNIFQKDEQMPYSTKIMKQ